MTLPNLTFKLPEWRENDFKIFAMGTSILSQMAIHAGLDSDRFKIAYMRIHSLAVNKTPEQIPQAIQTAVDVRAATYLLSNDKDFVKSNALSLDFIVALYKQNSRLSRLSLLQLIRAFFVFFDDLGGRDDVTSLAEFIRLQLAHHEGSQSENDLARLATNRELVFTLDGPVAVVHQAVAANRSLAKQFDLLALTGYGDGKYQRICRYQFYLETLKQIPVGSDHPVLKEITREEVFLAPGSSGTMLGHDALKILIDRSPAHDVSDIWHNIIMTIAGDPRIPKTNRRYQQWWSFLGDERIVKVRGWLSRVDLKLFLHVLKEFAESSSASDMKRMFPPRKRFMEGLLDQGLVLQSRLFINSRAEHFLRTMYRPEEIPEFARVNDGARSMIYLQVGHCHMIEGSHSFRLHIFSDMPSKSYIPRYNVNKFSAYDLTGRMVNLFLDEMDDTEHDYAVITHNPSRLNWQKKAIDFLSKQGIQLDLEKLFSPENYRLYKRYYGLPVAGTPPSFAAKTYAANKNDLRKNSNTTSHTATYTTPTNLMDKKPPIAVKANSVYHSAENNLPDLSKSRVFDKTNIKSVSMIFTAIIQTLRKYGPIHVKQFSNVFGVQTNWIEYVLRDQPKFFIVSNDGQVWDIRKDVPTVYINDLIKLIKFIEKSPNKKIIMVAKSMGKTIAETLKIIEPISGYINRNNGCLFNIDSLRYFSRIKQTTDSPARIKQTTDSPARIKTTDSSNHDEKKDSLASKAFEKALTAGKIIAFAREHNLTYQDNRPDNGCLWILADTVNKFDLDDKLVSMGMHLKMDKGWWFK
jgi:hypothetical protein